MPAAEDLNELRLHVRFDEGHGPVIVMLHGINSDGGDWRTVIDTIGPGYRFIALDLLGFGRSPKPLDIDYSADEHALVIENTLRDLGVDDQFLLVGYSLGGCIALRYASTYPERLRRLFLLDAPFYLPPEALELSSTGLRYVYEIASRWLWNQLASAKQKDGVLYKFASGIGSKALEDAFHADDIPTHWEVMSKNLENTVNKATWVEDLPKLTMPVVHAIGVRDAIVKVSQAPALQRLKPDLEIRRIGGLAADHMVLWNMPERVAEEIMRDEVRMLNVAWRGGSGTPLVLLHGLRYQGAAWRPVAEVLSATHEVAVIDLLGFGGSPAPLGLHYTLADHVAAVMGTVTGLWGEEARVRFVGEGLGAEVALGCAATVPERCIDVVAFSPTLLEPGTALEDMATDERSAQAIAVRETAQRLTDAERTKPSQAEQAEARLVAMLRSVDNAVLGIDVEALLGQIEAPVRIVVPRDDTLTPARYLEQWARESENFEFVSVPGERGLPYQDAAAAVSTIVPGDVEALERARATSADPDAVSDDPWARAARGVESALLRAGVLNLIAAAIIVVIHPVPAVLLTLGFAVWVAIASASAIFGALSMKGRTSGTRFSFVTTALPTLLLGVTGLALAAWLFADPASGRRFFGVAIAVYAMARGAADLFMALRVEDVSKPRWLLVAGGLFGVVTALAIVFGPNHGRGIVRLTLAAYLGLSGASMFAYVVANRRSAGRRVRELLGRAREQRR